MLPTFIIAGAGKSGTTSLWEYLKAHPQVCLASIKETQFFSTEAPSGRYYKGLDWYKNLFQPLPGVKAIGEATPSYMIKLETPRLIGQTLPNIQLLFLLRDPVDRLYSQYWFHRQQGLQLPPFEQLSKVFTFQQASVELPPKFEKLYITSLYHIHLERYLDYFPKDQIHVLLYEDLCREPNGFFKRVCRIIGVDSAFIPPNIDRRYNIARRARIAWLQRLLKALGPRLMNLDIPPWLFSTLKSSREKLWNLNTIAMQYPPMQPEIRKQLLENLNAAVEYVEDYLDRPLPEWRSV